MNFEKRQCDGKVDGELPDSPMKWKMIALAAAIFFTYSN